MRTQIQRMQTTFSSEDTDELKQDHRVFKNTVSREIELKNTLDADDYQTSFIDFCKIVNGWFPLVENFCSGIACVFSGKSHVGDVFSLVKFEKDNFHSQITDLSLEGVLHANKFHKLQQIRNCSTFKGLNFCAGYKP